MWWCIGSTIIGFIIGYGLAALLAAAARDEERYEEDDRRDC